MNDERKVYDARGNGDGECAPTITGDHADRVTDFCPIVLDMGGKIGAKFNMENVSPTITRGRGDADDVHAICFNVTACDANGTRKDRPNGGLYVTEAGSSRALTAGGGKSETLVCFNDTGRGDYWQKGDSSGTLRAEGENRPSRPSNVGCASFMGGQGSKAGGIGYAEDVSPTIKASPSGGNTIPDVLCVHGSQDPICSSEHAHAVGRNNALENCVALSVDCYNQTVNDGVAQSVRATGADSDNIPCVAVPDVIATIDGDKLNKKERAGDSGLGVGGGDVSYTCTAKDVHGVVTGGCRYSVRRLMPVETERLFGLPDGYTIPAGLDITDELVDEFAGVFLRWNEIESGGGPVKPKTRKWVRKWLEKVSNPETCPDAPRYKATGNSFDVNVVRWIGLGIQAVQDEIDAEERK